MNKVLPFQKEYIEELSEQYPTPFYLYDAQSIRLRAQNFRNAFSWVYDEKGHPGGYKNFFAVKALPNPHILKLLLEEGMGLDCSSQSELEIASRIGVQGHDIMFTSNNTAMEEYQRAWELGAYINLDDLSHIQHVFSLLGVPRTMCLRYNPGSLREGNAIIGRPEEAKYGITHAQAIEGYKAFKNAGVPHVGLHTMIASNERNPQYFIDTAIMMFALALELYEKVGLRPSFINLGGGIGIPYRLEDDEVDLARVSEGIRAAYTEYIAGSALHPLRLYTENGRSVTGPCGYLVTKVRHTKQTYKKYIGVDATMANLMRPGIYNAYHHITVLGKETMHAQETYDVVGSLCENNDKFAIDRKLPIIEKEDILVIHDVGAHGHAMGFNYNGKLRSAELLMRENGKVDLIRRAETIEDYLRTVIWE